MNGREKSDSAEVAREACEQNRRAGGGQKVERRAGTEGNAIPQKHVPDTGPEAAVTGAGSHTGGCKAQQEGGVHPRSCTTSHRRLLAGRRSPCDSQERGRRDRRNNVAGLLKQTSSVSSRGPA